MKEKLINAGTAAASSGHFSEQELYVMFLEEANRLTQNSEKAQSLAREALREFLKRHEATGNRNGD